LYLLAVNPRFPREKGYALRRLRDGIKDTPFGSGKDVSNLSTVVAVYGIVQHDVGPKWPLGNHASEKMDDLMKPSINVRFLGAYGFDLFVRPTIDRHEVRKYNEAIALHWMQMVDELREDRDKMSFGLPNVMQLFWMLHPLTFYSAEIGHVIFHAFELAAKDVEADEFMTEGEMFIQQMITPGIGPIRIAYEAICKDKERPAKVSPQSLDFWRKGEPTVGVIWTLLNSQY
jgi:hypothetical protein